MDTFTNDGLTFDVIDSGDAGTGGDTVVLLSTIRKRKQLSDARVQKRQSYRAD